MLLLVFSVGLCRDNTFLYNAILNL
jgi:hypothetical protein